MGYVRCKIGSESANYRRDLKKQCETLINRPLSEDFDREEENIAEEAGKLRDARYSAERRKNETAEMLPILVLKRPVLA